jgi:transcriptional regulator with XRE-family HTH domain
MRSPILARVARNVRKRRQLLGMSQQELGRKAGLHRTYIGSIERSERNVSILNLERIARALHVKIQELLE